MKILITSGGTKVPIDDVRFISNMSTGRLGNEFGLELLKLGMEVHFIGAKDSQAPHKFNFDTRIPNIGDKSKLWENKFVPYMNNYHYYEYSDYDSYKFLVSDIVQEICPQIAFMAAAVSDYTVDPIEGKAVLDTLKFKPTEKVLPIVKQKSPMTKVVGFKLVSGETKHNMSLKANEVLKSCDLVLANDLQEIKNGEDNLYLFKKNSNPILFVNRVDALKYIIGV